ncbi:hypothetical protein HGRIS_002212 [Hohenbuehelia grisea]|uniref:MYND-type domain-containing protein n=1 Tax=Hohenbuehelia grisea TaxID=104357 RepID=A0ABR3JKP7_9AGAR
MAFSRSSTEWLRKLDEARPSSPQSGAIILLFVRCRSSTWNDRIVEAVGGIPRLVKLIIERIDTTRTLDNGVCTHIAGYIDVLINLTHSTDAVSYALTAENAVLSLVRLMKRLLTTSLDKDRAICIQYSLQLLLMNIRKRDFRDGCTWVRKLLGAEEQILPRLLKALSKSNTSNAALPFLGQLVDLLLGFIPYLIYRPILRPVTKSLRVVADAGFEPDLEQVPILGKIWETFRALVKYRVDCKTEGYLFLCSQCDKPDINDKFAVCEGCLVATYYSKECQKKNWKAHREWCKSTRAMCKSAGVESFSAREEGCMAVVIRRELIAMSRKVRATKLEFKKEHPSIDPRTHILRLDYGVYPPEMRVIAPAELPTEVREIIVEMCKADGGSTIMVMVELPGSERTFTHAITEIPIDDEGMPRDLVDLESPHFLEYKQKFNLSFAQSALKLCPGVDVETLLP